MIISLFFSLGFVCFAGALIMVFAERKKNLIARLKRTDIPLVLQGNSSRKENAEKKPESILNMLEDWLARNNARISLQNFIFLIIFLLSAILVLSAFFKAGILIFSIASAILVFLIYIFIDLRGRRFIKKKEDQLEGVLIDLVTNLYVNPNISAALQKTAKNADEPIRTDIEMVIEDTRRGLLLNDALLNMLKRNRSRIIHVVITGLIAANEKGVDLVGFLKNQVDYLREKKSLANYVRILSTGPRYTSYLIIVIPLVVLLAASLINQGFAAILFSLTGRLVLVYSAISYTAGFLLINRIVSLTDDERGSGI